MLLTFLEQEIKKRKEAHNFRTLPQANSLIDFSSNDYLGFAINSKLKRYIQEEHNNHLDANGATGSRLLTGNSEHVEALEKQLSLIFKSEATLVFNSGYTANLAVLSSIPRKGDTILYDELAHACIKDGARLSLAKRFKFRHNDLSDLEMKIKQSSGQVFIVVESIYSMDGDFCPLKEIVMLARQYNAAIILDEAHSTGWLGERGSGYADFLNLEADVAIRIHTFGKAMGVHGASVSGSSLVINYLINFARPFIYTTALPPHSITAISCAFNFLSLSSEHVDKLNASISTFLNNTSDLASISHNPSCIQTCIIPGNEAVKKAAEELKEYGLDVRPILSPTVRAGEERLRICLHAFNTENEIQKLTKFLRTV